MTPESVVRSFYRAVEHREVSVELPVMDAFEVTPEGKIRAWRDYFDIRQFTNQLG